MKREKPYDLTSAIIEYESGTLDQDEEIELFQHLLDTGVYKHLQGSYQRRLYSLMEAGLVTSKKRLD